MYCPLCFTPLPPDGIAKIFTNTYFSRCVEIFSIQKETSVIRSCGNCKGTSPAAAVMYCKDCKIGYCDKCVSSHKDLALLKTHKTYSIENCLQSPGHIIEKLEACSSHTDSVLDQYCRKCNHFICQKCLREHSHGDTDNAVCSVNDLLDKKKSNINENIVQLKEQLNLVKKAITEIEDCEKKVATNCQKTVKEIEDKYNEVDDLLAKQKKNALEKVEMVENSSLNTLASQKEHLQLIEKQISACDKFSRDVIETNNVKTLINYSEWIVAKVGELSSLGDNTALRPLEFLPDVVKVEMTSPFLMVCTVAPEVPVLNIYGPIVKPKEVKIVLKLQDIVKSSVEKQSSS